MHIDPIAFFVGAFPVYWYALSYLAGIFFVAVFLFRWYAHSSLSKWSREDIADIIGIGFLGGLIGGRLGYVLWYDLPFFVAYPWRIIWPFDESGIFVGISGMSFFGALIGGFVALYVLAKKRGWNVRELIDDMVFAVPIGIFFGRIGNFLGGELYGRPSNVSWAMDFGDGISRHPSQLYEAFLEGVVLFVWLLWLSRRNENPRMITLGFLGGYGVLRFLVEFFREPDAQIGFVAFGWMTFGQLLSIAVIMFAVFWYVFLIVTRPSNSSRFFQKFRAKIVEKGSMPSK
jgi:phosphatidylglycerol:prolipoprotein diacylglycerol transferase